MDKMDYVGLKPRYAPLRDVTEQLPIRTATANLLAPPEIFYKIVELGAEKAKLSWWKTLWLGVLAGIYLSFAGTLLYFAGGQAPGLQASNPGLDNLLKGIFGLPFGLALILICGSELVTANFCYMPAALYEGRCTVLELLKNWFWSFWGNLAGSLFVVWMVDEAHLMTHGPSGAINNNTPVMTSMQKTHKTWGATVAAAFLANYMVCLAVWQATAAQDIVSKIFAVLMPVGAFVTIGLEHLVANMFLIPYGIKVGSPISVGRYIWHSLIPVAIGNCIGPAFFISGSYAFCYGTLGTRVGNIIFKMMNKGHIPETRNPAYDDSAHYPRNGVRENQK